MSLALKPRRLDPLYETEAYRYFHWHKMENMVSGRHGMFEVRTDHHEFYSKSGWGPNYWTLVDWKCHDKTPLTRREFTVLGAMIDGGFEHLPPRDFIYRIEQLERDTGCGFTRRNLVTVLRLTVCDSELVWL